MDTYEYTRYVCTADTLKTTLENLEWQSFHVLTSEV